MAIPDLCKFHIGNFEVVAGFIPIYFESKDQLSPVFCRFAFYSILKFLLWIIEYRNAVFWIQFFTYFIFRKLQGLLFWNSIPTSRRSTVEVPYKYRKITIYSVFYLNCKPFLLHLYAPK